MLDTDAKDASELAQVSIHEADLKSAALGRSKCGEGKTRTTIISSTGRQSDSGKSSCRSYKTTWVTRLRWEAKVSLCSKGPYGQEEGSALGTKCRSQYRTPVSQDRRASRLSWRGGVGPYGPRECSNNPTPQPQGLESQGRRGTGSKGSCSGSRQAPTQSVYFSTPWLKCRKHFLIEQGNVSKF